MIIFISGTLAACSLWVEWLPIGPLITSVAAATPGSFSSPLSPLLHLENLLILLLYLHLSLSKPSTVGYTFILGFFFGLLSVLHLYHPFPSSIITPLLLYLPWFNALISTCWLYLPLHLRSLETLKHALTFVSLRSCLPRCADDVLDGSVKYVKPKCTWSKPCKTITKIDFNLIKSQLSDLVLCYRHVWVLFDAQTPNTHMYLVF